MADDESIFAAAGGGASAGGSTKPKKKKLKNGMVVKVAPPSTKKKPPTVKTVDFTYEDDKHTIKERVDLRPFCSAVENQGGSNSCSANAVVGAIEMLMKKSDVLAGGDGEDRDVSRLFIYYLARMKGLRDLRRELKSELKTLAEWKETLAGAQEAGDEEQAKEAEEEVEGWEAQTKGSQNEIQSYVDKGGNLKDDGCDTMCACDCLAMKGVCSAEAWPFELEIVNSKPSKEVFSAAMEFKVANILMLPLADIGEENADAQQAMEMAMKALLSMGLPIIIGVNLTEPFMGTLGAPVPMPNPEDPQAAQHGSHAMLCVGYSERLPHFIVRNSWGTTWGDEGYCYMPFEYLCNGGPSDTLSGHFVALTAVIDPALDMGSLDAELDDSEPLWDEEAAPVEDEGGEPQWEDSSDDEDADDGDDWGDDDYDDDEEEDLFDPMQEARNVFEKFDADGSGEVDWRELKEALRCAGCFYSNKQVKRMQKTYDEDGSGALSFEEFIRVPGVLPDDLAEDCFDQMDAEEIETKREWLAEYERLRDEGVEEDEDGDNVEEEIAYIISEIEALELRSKGSDGEEDEEDGEEEGEQEGTEEGAEGSGEGDDY